MKLRAVHGERFRIHGPVKQQVFEYIEVYYNRLRIHSTLDYRSQERLEPMHAKAP